MTMNQFRAFLAVAIVCGLVFAGILTWHVTHPAGQHCPTQIGRC